MKKIGLILIGIVALALLSLYFVLDPNDHSFFPKCPLHVTTGIYCPGCGSQRALHSMLHLDIAGMIGYNALFLPALLTVGYHYAARFIPKRDGSERSSFLNNRKAPWIILTVVLVFWLLRNLTFYPFNILAP